MLQLKSALPTQAASAISQACRTYRSQGKAAIGGAILNSRLDSVIQQLSPQSRT